MNPRPPLQPTFLNTKTQFPHSNATHVSLPLRAAIFILAISQKSSTPHANHPHNSPPPPPISTLPAAYTSFAHLVFRTQHHPISHSGLLASAKTPPGTARSRLSRRTRYRVARVSTTTSHVRDRMQETIHGATVVHRAPSALSHISSIT